MGANISKDLKAFVSRVAKHVNADANARRRGRHRAAFIALRPHVEASLNGGHTMKATWETLHAEGRLSMTYETFRTHCRRARVVEAVASPPPSVTPNANEPRTAPVRAQPAMPRPATEPARTNDARAFQHERVPQKDEIYG